ncbi:MAG TPA: tetratricopeptide repeat protein [Bryobacteraceae bacterium]|nr:tetratricopeptide repeat protein [Bryobacteraceae bacterium]
MRGMLVGLLSLACLFGQPSIKQAEELYQRTDYRASLALLQRTPNPDGASYCLIGQNYFMLGDYKKATDAFQKALALEPSKSEYAHWLGRGFGRRAETSSLVTAPMHASKARQYFELAVTLDPSNEEALNDLFDYYLQAPGFLGGGYDKAEGVAQRIAQRNAAEGYFARAQLADKRKQFDTAEQQLRRAMDLAPRQVGRVLDLAKYLAKRGRIQESEAAFDKAEQLAPGSPKVCFARARTYVEQKRNLDKARMLLIKYLHSDLTPDDPPREQAEKLLKQVTGA